MMVHTMMKVLGTPIRPKGERKRGKGTGSRVGGMREGFRRKNQREGGREKRVSFQGCHLWLYRLLTAKTLH
jgi:hypothetical protein